MRGVAFSAVVVLFLTIGAFAPVAQAKEPTVVDIASTGSNEIVASIEAGEDLLAFASALFGEGTHFSIPTGLVWDYRVLAYWGPDRSDRMELRYRAPRGDVLGTACCLDSSGAPTYDPDSPEAAYVFQSAPFDAVILKYVQAPPSDGEPIVATTIAPLAVVVLGIAVVGGLLAVLTAAGRGARGAAGERR